MSVLEMIWINGSITPLAEARVSPVDHSVLTGDGCFETIEVIGGEPFALDRHIDRLDRSRQSLLLAAVDLDAIRTAIAEVIAANGGTDVGKIRVTITGGPSELGSGRTAGNQTVIVAAGPVSVWPDAVDVIRVDSPRNERGLLSGVKSISYADNVVALAMAHRAGASEALFANLLGNLCEGTGTNVFVGIDGRLVTPPLAAGPLAGVTRDLVLDTVHVVEADIAFADLDRCEEMFLTSSTRRVQPVRMLDGQQIAQCPGPLTRAAAAAFDNLIQRTLNP